MSSLLPGPGPRPQRSAMRSARPLPGYETSTDTRHTRWAVSIGAVCFVTLIGAAGFRFVPGVLMDPLHAEFGGSHATIGAAVSVSATTDLHQRSPATNLAPGGAGFSHRAGAPR